MFTRILRNKAFLMPIVLVLLVLMVSSEVYAWPGHGGWHGGRGGWGGGHHGRYYYHGGRYYYKSGWWWIGAAATTLALGAILASLPPNYSTVYVGGRPYYYYDGTYYKPCPNGYAVVRAPLGAVVTYVPEGYTPVIVNGVPYYNINGVTYMPVQNGYQVVPQAPQPQVVQAQPASAMTQVQETVGAEGVSAPPADNTITVNVPNVKGGYTSVTLNRKGKGYVGPQGEYYEEFPKISHLKEMYGK